MPVQNDLSFKSSSTNAKDPTLIQKIFFWITTYGKKIVIITEIIVIASLFSQTYFVRELNKTHKSIEDSKTFVLNSLETEKIFRGHIKDINFAKDTNLKKIKWSNVLAKTLENISSRSGIEMDSIKFLAQSTTFTGTANSSQDFAYLIQTLLSQEEVVKIVVTQGAYNSDDKSYSFSLSAINK